MTLITNKFGISIFTCVHFLKRLYVETKTENSEICAFQTQ